MLLPEKDYFSHCLNALVAGMRPGLSTDIFLGRGMGRHEGERGVHGAGCEVGGRAEGKYY